MKIFPCRLGVYLLVLSFAIPLHKAAATAIFEIATPDEIVIAADSEGLVRDGRNPVKVQAACKFFKTNDYYFALSGVVNDKETGFDLAKIVATAVSHADNFNDALSRLQRDLLPRVAHESVGIDERDPDGRRKTRPRLTSVFLATMEDDMPQSAFLQVPMKNEAGKLPTPEWKICRTGECEGTVAWISPETSTLPSHYPDIVKALRDTPYPAVAQHAIKYDIDAGVSGVTGPVDLLDMRRGGGINLHMKAGCPIEVPGTDE